MRYVVVIVLFIVYFSGCHVEVDPDDGSVADSVLDTKDTAQTPVVTIEAVKVQDSENICDPHKVVIWRLKSEPAPKTDLVVRIETYPVRITELVIGRGYSWVVIPKLRSSSEDISNTFYSNSSLSVIPLPTISVVGKGTVVDLETLQADLPAESLGGHKIPKDFDFPIYKIGDLSSIEVDVSNKGIPKGANFIRSDPWLGSDIRPNDSIRLLFDEDPGVVTVSEGEVSGEGNERIIEGPFPLGDIRIRIDWTNPCSDGIATIAFIVVDPDPPEIVESMPDDGEKDVSPEDVFRNGISVIFSEPVTGELRLMEADDNVGWQSKLDGNKITLTGLAGQKLFNETEYEIRGVVSDLSGNKTEVYISFTTEAASFDFLLFRSLVALWLFDEGAGNTVRDSGENGLHGRIIGGARWVDGKIGKGVNISGEGQSVVVENDRVLDVTTGMTIMGWIYPSASVTDRALISKAGSYYIGFDHTGRLEFIIQPGDITLFSLLPFNNRLRRWSHFAATFDGRSMKIYIDGEESVRREAAVKVDRSQSDLVIGDGFSGTIDSVIVYNRALKKDEITEILLNGF